ncbi:MAG: hypothetical protein MJA29_05455, partial [Candidatus Omnitrophica bacterium]|nr:hypothetical protein [Candidatus Omnitrophota bacterium]
MGEYADRLRRAHKADEHIDPNDEVLKEDLIDTFIEGLRKNSIRRSLINNMPEGWDAVVRKAKTLEVYSDKGTDITVLGPYFNEVNGPRDGNSDNSKLFQCMISCIEGMTKKLDEMQTQRQNIEMQQLCKELDNIAVGVNAMTAEEQKQSNLNPQAQTFTPRYNQNGRNSGQMSNNVNNGNRSWWTNIQSQNQITDSHSKGDGPVNGKGKLLNDWEGDIPRCRYCTGLGHFKRDCYKLKNKERQQQLQSNAQFGQATPDQSGQGGRAVGQISSISSVRLNKVKKKQKQGDTHRSMTAGVSPTIPVKVRSLEALQNKSTESEITTVVYKPV